MAMKTLPRYPFRDSDKNVCTRCGTPGCLCDVQITAPVQIATDIRHKYWDIAVDHLDDWEVTDRNFVEVASIVLGLFEVERAIPGMRYNDGRGPTEWLALPDEIQWNLKYHYRAGTLWEHARLELEDVDCDIQVIEKYYKERRRTALYERDNEAYAQFKRERRALGRQTNEAVECAGCGKVVTNTQGSRRTCSNKCRVRASRANRKEAKNG